MSPTIRRPTAAARPPSSPRSASSPRTSASPTPSSRPKPICCATPRPLASAMHADSGLEPDRHHHSAVASAAMVGVAYGMGCAHPLEAADGAPPDTWSLDPGSTVP